MPLADGAAHQLRIFPIPEPILTFPSLNHAFFVG